MPDAGEWQHNASCFVDSLRHLLNHGKILEAGLDGLFQQGSSYVLMFLMLLVTNIKALLLPEDCGGSMVRTLSMKTLKANYLGVQDPKYCVTE